MLIDGIQLAEGSDVTNLTVAMGEIFPNNASNGEFFLKSDAGVYNLYIYHSGSWNRVADEQSIQDTLGFTPVNKAGDTMTGALTLSGAPTQPLHAVTKSYVDGLGGGASSFTVTGDVTGTLDGGTDVLTLANTSVVAGSYGSGSQIATFSVNSKGQLTFAGNVAVTPEWASIASKPTTLGGYGITDSYTKTAADGRFVTNQYSIASPDNFTSYSSISLTTVNNKSRISVTSTGWQTAKVTSYKNTGKFVIEASDTTTNGTGFMGFSTTDFPTTGVALGGASGSSASFSVSQDGDLLISSTEVFTKHVTSAPVADANVPYMIAIDLDAGKAWVCYAGTWIGSGDPSAGLNPTFSWNAGSLSLAPAGTPNQLGQGGALDFNFGTTAFVNPIPVGFAPGWGTAVSSLPMAKNVQGGASGNLLYQSAANVTGFIGVGTSGQVLISNGTAAPTWSSSPTLNLSSSTADGTNAVGFRHIPQNSRSADYTLVLEDAGKHIFHPATDAAARTITIPSNASVAFPIGTAITFINQHSSPDMTIAINGDTMRLAGAGTTGNRTLAANGVATAIKVTATTWIISGTNLT